jgi:3-ketosteroid 9alpha-monooxygenase subunit B
MKNHCELKTETRKTYVVKEKIIESPTVSTLKLTLFTGDIPTYHSGQFINIYFPELGTPEGKAYSMSGAPHEDALCITVKAVGEFSHRLCSLCVGDTLEASLPYGYFYSESEDNNLIMIAGGIGVTPFRSMIMDSIRRKSQRKLALFYSSRTYDDLIFKKEFDSLQKDHKNFNGFYFVTRERNSDTSIIYRRMNIGDILGNGPQKRLAGREFLICGSISFVSDIWKGLRAAGVPEELIYTEAFFSH